MSESQQKLMQYLPVAFAVFQIFFLLGLVVYYIVQSILRILQQFYITKRFYGSDESLGRQAQAASERARELAKADGGGGPLAQARRDLTAAKNGGPKNAGSDDQAATKAKTKEQGQERRARAGGPSVETYDPAEESTDPIGQEVGGRNAGRPGGRPASTSRRKRK